MKKRFAFVLVLAMLCGLLGGCGAKEEPAPAPDAEEAVTEEAGPAMEPIVLKYATSFASSATSTVHAQAAADRIAEKTNGAITFEFYPDNQLGNLTDTLEQVMSGMPIMMFSGLDMLGNFVPEANVADVQYVLQDMWEIFPLVESDWWAGVEADIIETMNVTPVAYGTVGYRHYIGTKPISCAADMKDVIARMPPSAVTQGFVMVHGGSPTTSTWADNYSLLQTGVFDVCETDVQMLWTSSLQEVSQYLSLTGHSCNPCAIYMNTDLWESIPAEYQQLIHDEFYAAMRAAAEELEANEGTYIQKFKDYGITVIEDVDKASFAEKVPEVFAHVGMDPALYDTVRAAIESAK